MMETILPARLKPGDTIGVVSPSTPVGESLQPQLDCGVEFLRGLGFQVALGEYVSSRTMGWYAAAPEEKAGDIHSMFADPTVQAIICSQGGATANACLPYLDWELIRSHPKVFLGISDITVLLNAIYTQTGLVTFHGNDLLWGFGRGQTAYDRAEFLGRLVNGEIGSVRTSGRERLTIRVGTAEGRLLGGNLTCLLKLAGTPYFPNMAGAILFLEDIDITPEHCDHALSQLKQMGVFDQIRGAVVGYIDGLDNVDDQSIHMEDVLLRVTAEYDFPILKAGDFGHNCPNTVLPVGGRVRIDAGERVIEIMESCVE